MSDDVISNLVKVEKMGMSLGQEAEPCGQLECECCQWSRGIRKEYLARAEQAEAKLAKAVEVAP